MRHSGDFRAVGSFQMYKRPRVLTLTGSHVEIVMDHTQSGDNRFRRSVWQFSDLVGAVCVEHDDAESTIRFNATAGEQSDDAGESVDCNDDCTPALCGDAKVNTTAG